MSENWTNIDVIMMNPTCVSFRRIDSEGDMQTKSWYKVFLRFDFVVTAKNSGEKVISSVMRNQVGYLVIRLERKFMHHVLYTYLQN